MKRRIKKGVVVEILLVLSYFSFLIWNYFWRLPFRKMISIMKLVFNSSQEEFRRVREQRDKKHETSK